MIIAVGILACGLGFYIGQYVGWSQGLGTQLWIVANWDVLFPGQPRSSQSDGDEKAE